ncbi:MAG: class I SAM-dependent methyltransferase [Acidobacteriota bacterium]|nr:class I SAM-dependent methyltransferase [Acidobacteriota bacterium]
MNIAALSYRLPRFLKNHVLHFEAAIESSVARFAKGLPFGARVLDAGAGERRHAHFFDKQRYVAIDLAVGDASWNYKTLDAIADLSALPFAPACFDAALNIVTLEHLRDPAGALREIARTLHPGAPLLLVAPHEWEVHQAPHDYFRYTRHGLTHLLEQAGFGAIEIEPVGGYFRLLSRRLLNGLQFFSGGPRWILFLPAAGALIPPAMILPFFDFLDGNRNFTLGYICTAKRLS